MSATKDTETVLCSRNLALDQRRPAGPHGAGDARIAILLSGLIATRQQDGVICPNLVNRQLVVPAYEPAAAQAASVR